MEARHATSSLTAPLHLQLQHGRQGYPTFVVVLRLPLLHCLPLLFITPAVRKRSPPAFYSSFEISLAITLHSSDRKLSRELRYSSQISRVDNQFVNSFVIVGPEDMI
jgi:hypothetical protein